MNENSNWIRRRGGEGESFSLPWAHSLSTSRTNCSAKCHVMSSTLRDNPHKQSRLCTCSTPSLLTPPLWPICDWRPTLCPIGHCILASITQTTTCWHLCRLLYLSISLSLSLGAVNTICNSSKWTLKSDLTFHLVAGHVVQARLERK